MATPGEPPALQSESSSDVATGPLPPAPADSKALSPPAPAGASPGRPTVPGYEIITELGRGGMGVVYKARQVGLNRLVALKMILAGGHAGPDELARFRREAEAVARVKHPNIVQVYDVGEAGGLPYFSLEFVEGGSLDKKLAGAPLPPADAAALVETLARAMAAAHAAGLVHRDLKPANVLLAADGTPKVSDFGLVKKLDAVGQTASGAVLGTPSYMAPEQAGGRSKEIGPACDVYALGAILYECLTGRPPFRAATALDTLMQVIADAPVPPRRLNTRVSVDLETVCLKCLEKEAGRRYESAAALADDLRRFTEGRPVLARPVGPVERVAKWATRRPAAAAVLAGALLMVVGLGIVWGRSGRVAALAATEELDRREGEQRRAHQEAVAGRTRGDRQLAKVAVLWETYPQEALRLLEDEHTWPPGLRDSSWEGFHRLCQLDRTTLGHHKPPVQLAATSDGRTLLALSEDGAVKLWDVVKGREVRTLAVKVSYDPAKNARPLALTADGDLMAYVRGKDGTLVLHPTGLGTSHENFGIFTGTPAFSPDGRTLAVLVPIGPDRADNLVLLIDTRSGEGLNVLGDQDQGRATTALAFTPDGRTLAAVARDGKIQFWDMVSGRVRGELVGQPGAGFGLAFTPDGRSLALRCDRPPDARGRQQLPVVLLLDMPQAGEEPNGPAKPGP